MNLADDMHEAVVIRNSVENLEIFRMHVHPNGGAVLPHDDPRGGILRRREFVAVERRVGDGGEAPRIWASAVAGLPWRTRLS